MSNKTINSYESKVRLLAEYLVNELNIDSAEEVKEIHLKSYIRYLQERGKYTVVANENSIKTNNPQNRANYNKKISDITINNYIRNIKVFFNYLYNEKIIRTNPVTRIKR